MTPIRVAGFGGCNPSLQPRQLSPEIGVYCENQNPGQGDLRPWKVPLTVATVPAGRLTLYRFNRDVRSDANYWFSLTTVGRFARSFLEDDTTERTYFTAATGGLKVTNNIIGLAGAPYPTASRDVGLPTPLTAPIITQTTAGTGDDEERYYVYVYVNDWDEVSAPSPVSAVFTCKPGVLANITSLAAPPGGSHGINRIRVYRTAAGSTGADFFFLREISLATSTTDDARALGRDILESGGPSGTVGFQWSVPPTDLKSIASLWNGMLAGISGKAVQVCEPYKLYAWPPAYATPSPDQPVTLATFGKSLLVLTTGTPLLMYGSSPEAMEAEPVGMVLPCESEPGVVSFKHGVAWPSADGLAYIGRGGPQLLTAGLMTRDQWRAMNPTSMVAGQYQGMYVCFYLDGATRKGFAIDPLNPGSLYPLATGYPACYFDELQGTLYVLDGANVQKWDAGASSMTALHRSKVFRQPKPVNPGVAEIVADGYPVTFKLWAGTFGNAGWSAGALKLTRTVTNREPFKLPGGYLADDLQIEVAGQGPIVGVIVARSIEDLSET